MNGTFFLVNAVPDLQSVWLWIDWAIGHIMMQQPIYFLQMQRSHHISTGSGSENGRLALISGRPPKDTSARFHNLQESGPTVGRDIYRSGSFSFVSTFVKSRSRDPCDRITLAWCGQRTSCLTSAQCHWINRACKNQVTQMSFACSVIYMLSA